MIERRSKNGNKKIDSISAVLCFVKPDGGFAGGAAEGVEKSGETLTYEDYEYVLTDHGTVMISKYKGVDSFVVIPDSINGKKVTSIGSRAFWNCCSLTSVTIPDSVISIGPCAFSACFSLTSVTIPGSVISIGLYAFEDCDSLRSVTIPGSVIAIDLYAFEDCDSLTSVTIPDSVISIEYSAFRNCDSLTRVTIPGTVISIGDYAFGFCWNSKMGYSKIPNFTIYGTPGTAAEEYAIENGFRFININDPGYITSAEKGLHLYSNARNNTMKLGETYTIGASYFGGNSSGYDFSDKGKVTWEFSDPEVFEAVHSDDKMTALTVKAAKVGSCYVTLLVGGKKAASATYKVRLNVGEVSDSFSTELMYSSEKELLDNGLSACKEIAATYNDFDKKALYALNDVGNGLSTITNNTFVALGLDDSKRAQSMDNIVMEIMAEYYNGDYSEEPLEEVSDFVDNAIKDFKNGARVQSVVENIGKLAGLKSTEAKSLFEEITKSMKLNDLLGFGSVLDAGSTVLEPLTYYLEYLTVMKYDKAVVEKMIYAVEKDPYTANSDYHAALLRFRQKLNDSHYYFKEYGSDKVLSILGDVFGKTLKATMKQALGSTLSSTTSIVDASLKIGYSLYKLTGNPTIDGLLDTLNAVDAGYAMYYALKNSTNSGNIKVIYDVYRSTVITALKHSTSFGEKLLNTDWDSDRLLKRIQAMVTARSTLTYISNPENYEEISAAKYLEKHYKSIVEKKYLWNTVFIGAVMNISTSGSSPFETIDIPEISVDEILVIPTIKDDKRVIGIADYGFSGMNDKKSVLLPGTVKSIGSYAFADSQSLLMVMGANELEAISDHAFDGCTSLQIVNIPDTVTSIGESSFANCDSLSRLSIGADTIGSKAFANCATLKYIEITNRTADIAEDAFNGIEDSVTIIGYKGSTAEKFANDHGMVFEVIPEYVKSISINTPANKTEYMRGEEINTEGLTLNVEYLDGTSEIVSEGFIAVADDHNVNVYYLDGRTSYTINVTEDTSEQRFSINEENLTLLTDTGTKLSLTDNILNIQTTAPAVWSSESPDIATVDNNGYVIGVKPGETKIKAEISENMIFECTVTVVSSQEQTLQAGEKEYIFFTPLQDAFTSLLVGNADVHGVLINPDGHRTELIDGSLIIAFHAGEMYTLELFSDNDASPGISVKKLTVPVELLMVDEETEISDQILGDVDSDGEITANDALTILRASVGLSELTPNQTKFADTDGDGQITANDALSVLRYSVGLADEDSPIGKPIAA